MLRISHLVRPATDTRKRPLVDPFVLASGPWATKPGSTTRAKAHVISLRAAEEAALDELHASRRDQLAGSTAGYSTTHVIREALALYYHLHFAPLRQDAAEARAKDRNRHPLVKYQVPALKEWWATVSAPRFIARVLEPRGITSLEEYLALAAAAACAYVTAHPADASVRKWAQPLADTVPCETRELSVALDPALIAWITANISPDIGRVLPRLELIFRNRKLRLAEAGEGGGLPG